MAEYVSRAQLDEDGYYPIPTHWDRPVSTPTGIIWETIPTSPVPYPDPRATAKNTLPSWWREVYETSGYTDEDTFWREVVVAGWERKREVKPDREPNTVAELWDSYED